MPRPIFWLTLILCLSVSLTACTPQTATPGSAASPSPAANPVSATAPGVATTDGAPTATPAAIGTPAAAGTAAPEAPTLPAQVEPPTAAPEASCVNDARFVRDVTIPDGTQFLPGQLLIKKWSVQNAGSCNWGPNYRLVFIGGDSLAAASEVALYPALAGTDATWEIPMVAPQAPGAYTSRWQARDPAGNLFGGVVFIKINVIPMPTAPSP